MISGPVDLDYTAHPDCACRGEIKLATWLINGMPLQRMLPWVNQDDILDIVAQVERNGVTVLLLIPGAENFYHRAGYDARQRSIRARRFFTKDRNIRSPQQSRRELDIGISDVKAATGGIRRVKTGKILPNIIYDAIV